MNIFRTTAFQALFLALGMQHGTKWMKISASLQVPIYWMEKLNLRGVKPAAHSHAAVKNEAQTQPQNGLTPKPQLYQLYVSYLYKSH